MIVKSWEAFQQSTSIFVLIIILDSFFVVESSTLQVMFGGAVAMMIVAFYPPKIVSRINLEKTKETRDEKQWLAENK